jgi:AcrR family transcriptional regulator
MTKKTAARRGADQGPRELLLAAAVRLIARDGTAGLTVRQIAREAGLADGLLYNHFADKEELLALAVQAHVRTVGDGCAGLAPNPGDGTVEANLRTYLATAITVHAALLPAFAGLLGQPRVLTRFAELPNPLAGGRGLRAGLSDYLRGEQKLRRVAPEADVEAAATLIVGACHELVLPRLLFTPSADVADVPAGFVNDLVATVLRGIAQPD